MKHNPLGGLCFALAWVTVAIGAYDLMWFYKYSDAFIPALNPHLIKVILFSCLMALANGFVAVGLSNESKIFYADLLSICRQFWVYHYLLLLMNLFNSTGRGGRNEAVFACGKVLDAAGIAPQPIPPPFACFHGCRLKRAPCSRFVWHCMRLVETQICGIFFLIAFKSTLAYQGLLFDDADASCPHEVGIGKVLGFVQLLFVFIGLGGIIPLVTTLTKIVLPERQATVMLRNRLYIFMLPWSAAVQTVLIFKFVLPNFIGECSSKHADQVTLAIEMVIFQIISHRAFVPMFTWKPAHAPPPAEIPELLEKGTFAFVAKTEEMAGLCGGNGASVAADSPVGPA